MNDLQLEIWRQLRAARDKYSYFMLAATGACIGFALTQANGVQLSLKEVFLALALLCWIASFQYGTVKLRWEMGNLSLAFQDVQKDVKGRNEVHVVESGGKPWTSHYDTTPFNLALDSRPATVTSALQGMFLGAGVVLYIFWRVAIMW